MITNAKLTNVCRDYATYQIGNMFVRGRAYGGIHLPQAARSGVRFVVAGGIVIAVRDADTKAWHVLGYTNIDGLPALGLAMREGLAYFGCSRYVASIADDHQVYQATKVLREIYGEYLAPLHLMPGTANAVPLIDTALVTTVGHIKIYKYWQNYIRNTAFF